MSDIYLDGLLTGLMFGVGVTVIVMTRMANKDTREWVRICDHYHSLILKLLDDMDAIVKDYFESGEQAAKAGGEE